MIYKTFLAGVIILISAIALNIIANHFGITTWYSFLNEIKGAGIKASIAKQGVLSLFFLFLIYPFTLGLAAYFSFYFLR